MDYRNFDAIKYIEKICSNSKFITANRFVFEQISGIQGAEELLEDMRRESAFIAIDDTPESIVELKEEGPFEREMFTVFVLKRFNMKSMDDRKQTMAHCKRVRNLIMTWLLKDKSQLCDAMIYLDAEVPSRDTGVVLNGVTGCYFTFSYSIPTSMEFDQDEWIDPDMNINNL